MVIREMSVQRDADRGHLSCPVPVSNTTSNLEVSQPLDRLQMSSDGAVGTSSSARQHEPDTSILLIGMRGSGLSTLAFMAARALKYRVLDSDHIFYKTTGMSRVSYNSTHGAVEYRRQELELLRSTLFQNGQRSIIVCSLGAVQGTGQAYIAEFGQKHPVIHILRDAQAVQQHLKAPGIEVVSDLIRRSEPIYRRLSTFEFYNLCDSSSGRSASHDEPSHSSSEALSLKRLEQDFVRLTQGIASSSSSDYDARQTPISCTLDSRQYTYVIPIQLSDCDQIGTKASDIDSTADALELMIRSDHSQWNDLDESILTKVSRQYCLAKRHSRLPVIFHAQRYAPYDLESRSRPSETVPDKTYLELVHHGLRLGPEYLCVDLSLDEAHIRQLVASKGLTRIIGDFHDRDPGPNGWDKADRKEVVQRAERLGCEFVRITQVATTMNDNFAVRQFAYQVKTDERLRIRLIAYNTGRLGRTSHFLNEIFTPVKDPGLGSLEHPSSSSDDLLTVREAQAALYSSLVLDRLKFGIYGSNVAQSLSPYMHNAAFKRSGMPHEYGIFELATLEHLPQLIHQPDFGGMSISAPFKRDVRQYVDSMSDEARAIGAINTVLPLRTQASDALSVRNRAGRAQAVYGDNTDWAGIYVCVQQNLSPINAVESQTTALILGAGGMARAALFALIRLGIRTIFIHNRTVSNATELANQFHGKTFSQREHQAQDHRTADSTTNKHGAVVGVLKSRNEAWPSNVPAPTVIVSCVAVHEVDGEPSADCTLPASWLASKTGGVAVELAYTPIDTPFLQQVRSLSAQGWIACDGLQVLPEQGVKQFELFTGRKAPQDLMRGEISRIFRQSQTKRPLS